ncbi:MAG: pilus assembly protein [Pirellula sp.]|jgi:Flp pilus assembly protein TadG|nr:pilus assembly protein [Pirellula sp.]
MSKRKQSRIRTGAVTVEFAIIANMMFVVIFGCLELTRLSLIRNLAQDAAYFAARVAIVPGATVADATREANRILGTMGTRGVQVVINDGQGISQGTEELKLEVVIDLQQNMILLPLMPGSKEIRTKATMKTERYDEVYQGG